MQKLCSIQIRERMKRLPSSHIKCYEFLTSNLLWLIYTYWKNRAAYTNQPGTQMNILIFMVKGPQTNIVERKSHLLKAKNWKPVLKSFDVWAEQLRLDSENEKFRSAVQILGGAPQHSKLNFVFCLYSGSKLPLTAVRSFFYNNYIKIRYRVFGCDSFPF